MRHEPRPPSMLAIMPFPALNPWNWGAVTPMAAMATGITMTRIGLSAWHAYADASRAIWRERQESMLTLVEKMLSSADEAAAAEGVDDRQASPEPHQERDAA